jgi:hypothetical protein
MGGGFFVDYGQPETVILVSLPPLLLRLISLSQSHRYTYFWPWDSERVIGRAIAVGHFLRLCRDSVWYEGQITNYDEASDTYDLRVIAIEDPERGKPTLYPLVSSASLQPPESEEESSPPPPTLAGVDLKRTLHTWIDVAHREHLPKSYSSKGRLLEDSEQDVGKYIRAWWPLYHRDYYGKVLSYDPVTGLHMVGYEDKDSRSVNMKEKDYEVLSPIPDSVLASASGRSPCSAAAVVGTWHRSNLQQNAKYAPPSDPNPEPVPVAMSPEGPPAGIFIRPDLSVSLPHSFSYHHADLVDTFYTEGGFSSLFQSLRDTSLPPPDALVIILHMRLLYALRQKLEKTVVEDLVWDAKELIPFTILRFEEHQIKSMTKSDLQVILSGLKDLVMVASPTNCNIQRDIDILHISLAHKLLTCSQIQKRYLGLSILKEEIESAMPQVLRFLSKPTKQIVTTNYRSPAAQLAAIPKKSHLGIEFIERWILENNIFEAIFVRSVHQELIAKSEFLIIFLALRKSLGEEHVNAIWQSSIGGHEAVVRVIHQLILNIIPVLDLSLRLYLFNLISIIPFTEYSEQHLNLIKSYTVQAIKLIQKEEALNSPSSGGGGAQGSDTPREEDGAVLLANGDSENLVGGNGRRGQVINAPQRNWLGFAVLWQFIQDQSASGANNQQILHIDVSLVDMAVDLLVDLLKEEFKNDREIVIQRCVQNIRTGVSVPVSAKILHMTLSLYPTSSGGWFSSVGNKSLTVTLLIERIHKQYDLIESILEELEEYHKVFNEQIRSQSKEKLSALEINDFRIKAKGKIGRISHLHGVKERLKLLSVILWSSSISLQEPHLSTLWKVFVTESISTEVTDEFIRWIGSCLSLESKQFNTFLSVIIQEDDGLTSSQTSKLDFLRSEAHANGDFNTEKTTGPEDGEHPQSFEEGVLKQLLENKLGPLAFSSSIVFGDYCRRNMAVFVVKLFLYVNASPTTKSIRFEQDSSWYRSSSVEPIGLPLLWRLATDAEDAVVSDAASYLLIELFQRMPPSKGREADSIRSSFLQYCFSQISVSINHLQQVESNPDTDDTEIIHPPVQLSILSLRVKRYVSLMKNFVQRFTHCPRQFSRIIVLSNRSQAKMFELNVTLDESILTLRATISKRLQIAAESLVLNRTKLLPGTVSELGPFEKLEKDEVSLRSLKFKPSEHIVVTRLETVEAEKPTGVSREGAIGKVKKEDVILSKHLASSFIPPLNPFEWLGMEFENHSDHALHLNEPITSLSRPDDLNQSSKIFTMPSCPLTHHSDMVLESRNSNTHNSHKAEHLARLAEYLGPYLLKFPDHFDHLLQMLDGYLSLKSEVVLLESVSVS